MIKVNTAHIGPDGMLLEGEEESSSLELFDVRTGAAAGFLIYKLNCVMAGRDLLVTGSLHVAIKAECARCLQKLDLVIETDNVCHHFEGVPERELDITPEIREDILLAMPQTFLCNPDCKGLCPKCGADLNKERCKCKQNLEETGDWSALDGLKF